MFVTWVVGMFTCFRVEFRLLGNIIRLGMYIRYIVIGDGTVSFDNPLICYYEMIENGLF